MQYLAAVLAFAACSSVLAGTATEPKQRDGSWLQRGIREYQRLNAHDSLSEQDADAARSVTSYVCAVVDTQKHLVQRANLLVAALQAGKKRKQHLDAKLLDGMTRTLPMIVPLLQTGFFADSPSCDQALLIVQGFLEKYPEVLDKDADAVIEKALLDAYDKSRDPP